MKVFECVQVKHHNEIGKIIGQWQRNGWRLHTYQATGRDIWINHYLLFERESNVELAATLKAAAAVATAGT
jgi:hypothetical protein